MKNWGGALRFLGFSTVLVTIVTAFFTFGAVRNNIESIRINWQENLLWSSSQLNIEYQRFLETLLGMAGGQVGVDRGEVNRRFNILWSRVALFQHTKTAQRIEGFNGAEGYVERIFESLKQAEPTIEALQDGDRAAALALWRDFKAYEDQFRRFNRIVMHGEVEAGAELRRGLVANQALLFRLGNGAAVFSFLLLMYFAYETRLHRKMSQKNAALFRQAQQANRTKSAFLNMMSHELRTPMNGISGMIALARQQGGSPQQAEMLSIAEKSSQQLNEMLLDIVEFADLETANVDLLNKPFLIRVLCAQIDKALRSVGQAESVNFQVECAPECPLRMRGDLLRLRQTLVHMARYLAIMSRRDVRVFIGYHDGKLGVSLYYDQTDLGDGWLPHFINVNQQGSDDRFAKSELGTEIACGFINRMNGSLSHQSVTTGQGQAAVHVNVPLVALETDTITVRLETRSQALAAICQNAMASFPVRMFQPDDTDPVHTVIIEAGGTFEHQTYERLVALYPEANFVALGAPSDKSRYEGQISLPIDITALKVAPFL